MITWCQRVKAERQIAEERRQRAKEIAEERRPTKLLPGPELNNEAAELWQARQRDYEEQEL